MPKLAALMDEAGEDVRAVMTVPREHCAEVCSTNSLERVKGETKRHRRGRHLPNVGAVIGLAAVPQASSSRTTSEAFRTAT